METMQQNESPQNNLSSDAVDEQSAEGHKVEAKGEDLSEALAASEAEAAEYKDKFLRAAAEMENMRRRMEKERSDLLLFGLEKIMSDLLPVLDAFDKAHTEAASVQSGNNNPLYEGLMLLQKQLVTALERHGLQEVNPKGNAFDPNLHQAIQKIDQENIEIETVHEVFQKGYTLNNRLVRPAMVCVAVPSRSEENK